MVQGEGNADKSMIGRFGLHLGQVRMRLQTLSFNSEKKEGTEDVFVCVCVYVREREKKYVCVGGARKTEGRKTKEAERGRHAQAGRRRSCRGHLAIGPHGARSCQLQRA